MANLFALNNITSPEMVENNSPRLMYLSKKEMRLFPILETIVDP